MVVDFYADVRSLRQALEAQALTHWAQKLDDIVTGGSTGTEIVMGVRWLLQQLGNANVTVETQQLIDRIRATTDALLQK